MCENCLIRIHKISPHLLGQWPEVRVALEGAEKWPRKELRSASCRVMAEYFGSTVGSSTEANFATHGPSKSAFPGLSEAGV